MFYDKFKSLCDQSHTTPNAVCLELGLSNAVAPYWKRTGSTPKLATLQKIADFFGVSISYFTGSAEHSNPEQEIEPTKPTLVQPSGITESEREILVLLRKLTDVQKGELIGRAKMMAEQNAADDAVYVADENVS